MISQPFAFYCDALRVREKNREAGSGTQSGILKALGKGTKCYSTSLYSKPLPGCLSASVKRLIKQQGKAQLFEFVC